jgi:hypothetical protein
MKGEGGVGYIFGRGAGLGFCWRTQGVRIGYYYKSALNTVQPSPLFPKLCFKKWSWHLHETDAERIPGKS